MNSLIFSFEPHSSQKYVNLHPLAAPPAPAQWTQLAADIGREASLTAYTAQQLAHRWEQGCAVLAAYDGRIVSYTSLVPVFNADSRARLSQLLNLPADQLPAVNVYEFASGWTHPDFRRRGISLQLRRCLLARFDRPDILQVSISIGLGASPVLERMGWQIIGWQQIAWVSSLIGLPAAAAGANINRGWQPPAELKQYNGAPIIPSQTKTHPWSRYCHFWVSNPALARDTDKQLQQLLHRDLLRWQTALGPTQTRPSAFGWKPILFGPENLA